MFLKTFKVKCSLKVAMNKIDTTQQKAKRHNNGEKVYWYYI